MLANATADADTIVLEAGCTYLVAGSGPLVTQPLTIRGNGATLTRDPASPIGPLLRVQGWAGSGGFAVDDVTFTGGTGTQGALSVQAGGDTSSPAPAVTVTNSSFHDNTQLQVPDFDPGYVGAGLSVETSRRSAPTR